MNVRVTRLGPGHLARAEEVIRTFKGSSRSPASLEAFLRNPANYLLVAEVDGEAAGALLAHRLERAHREACQMFVYEVDVAAAWRGQGLATSLLEAITRQAQSEGMFEAFTLTSRGNEAARRLYAGAGGIVEDDEAILYVFPLGE